MRIFISSMVYSGWHDVGDVISGGLDAGYTPGRVPDDADWVALGAAVNLAAEAGFFTADQIILLAGSDARIDAEYEAVPAAQRGNSYAKKKINELLDELEGITDLGCLSKLLREHGRDLAD